MRANSLCTREFNLRTIDFMLETFDVKVVLTSGVKFKDRPCYELQLQETFQTLDKFGAERQSKLSNAIYSQCNSTVG